MDDIAEPGYESDTGERDNPTCKNFKTATPVVQTEHAWGSSRRKLNREGRAICRIVYAHDWTLADIGQIFNVSTQTIRRAVENVGISPRDLVEEDYARVKDPDFFEILSACGGYSVSVAKHSDYEPDSGHEAVYRFNGRPARRAAQDNMYESDGETGEKRKYAQVSHESASAPPFFTAKKPRCYAPDTQTPKEIEKRKFESYPFADPGYESDTGKRDIPSCDNFRKGIPVQKTLLVGHIRKVLNREGRAICRIVHAHGWSYRDIATIFGVSEHSVRRAIDNVRYTPRDRVEEDYMRVRDPGFGVYFPPLESSASHKIKREQKICVEKPQERRASAPSYPSIFKGLPGYPTNTRTSSAPQLPVAAPLPAPHISSAAPTSSALPSFLANVMNLNSLSAHHELLSAQGFSALRLQIMAAWPRPAIEEALARTLMGIEILEVGWESLDASQVIALEVGVWKLKSTLPLGSPLPPLVGALPSPESKFPRDITLTSFLQNVMGFDLSAHCELLDAQGLDVVRLGTMTTWDSELVKEMVGRLFVHEPRMSKLEALALEFALRGLGAQ
ncbi:hypothetical protein FB45DRAFT_1064356 [Roridomyces roridus]|uniref:Uncharacterized protein n=1 Tax=Roridomyces roridus TaxID=1738132 RepID=A0AAD7FFC5_9AGAR|nr:hypothetical protein FB45DRAFT_1064356 [Roridomyces roridus]